VVARLVAIAGGVATVTIASGLSAYELRGKHAEVAGWWPPNRYSTLRFLPSTYPSSRRPVCRASIRFGTRFGAR
jgi:hypothetical protein